MRPRYRKIIADLWGHKVRSLLVVASIAVGLFAVGMIATIHEILKVDMATGYAAVNPTNIQITTQDFDQDLVDNIRHIQGVKEAEGVRSVNLRLETSPGEWTQINLLAIPNFEDRKINRIDLEYGKWPPGKHELAMERNKLAETNAKLADKVTIELPSGKIRQLSLTGTVHDQTVGSSNIGGGFFLAPVQGYINMDTLEWLGEPRRFNTIQVTISGDNTDLRTINQVDSLVRQAVEDSGRTVINPIIRTSLDHPTSTYVDAMAGVLLLLGLLVVFLSGFLITNTLSALLNQQIEQVGIMKTVGARRWQIVALYMVLIFIFGAIAFTIALPLSNRAAFAFLQYLSTRINFDLAGYRLPLRTVILEVVIAVLVPQVAAFLPIWHGSNITVQAAFSGLGDRTPAGRQTWLDRRIMSIRRLSRPLLISLRNTFRRKGRLLLTLITLTMGGAIFIATFNVQASLRNYIARVSNYFLADVNLTLDQPYRIERIRAELAGIPEIDYIEGWAQARPQIVMPDGSIGESISLLAPPADSRLVKPIMLRGRWIIPGDQNAIVLSERFQSVYPGLQVGDSLDLKINGKDFNWTVVGFFQLAGKSGGFLAYSPYDYLSAINHQPGKAQVFRILSREANMSLAQQKTFGTLVETRMRSRGFRILDITAGKYLTESAARGLNILMIFLLIMAMLTASVGSIGLAGTMSLNVMERTREIGVMRSIGASDRILTGMVMVEGMIIGLLSWIFGLLAAIPISKVMSDIISLAIFDAPSNFTFTPVGVVAWLGVVVVLSALASILPARNAARLTIREVLAYE